MLNILIKSQIQKFIVYIFLTIIILAVYWQVNQFDFSNYGDPFFVTNNSHVLTGITPEGLCWSFTTKYLGLWHPLTWLSLMFDYQLHELNASGYHVTNLILHIISTLLLFWLFNRMTGAVWKSAFVAAFFALHPLHVESVAWIAERKDVLSAFFWMLTLCFYVYYTEKPAVKRYVLVLFSFVLAIMSKPMVITLPVIMILLDYWPLKRFNSKKENLILWQIREKTPFFILSIIIVITTLYNPNTSNVSHFSLIYRLANSPVAFITYLYKTVWPHDMAFFYPFLEQIPVWKVIGTSFVIIIISTAAIVMAKRLPYVLVGWLWYAITIIPVIGIIEINGTTPSAMADRYHYLPSIGIAVILAWGISSLIKSKNMRMKIVLPTTIVFIVILSILTWNQCGYWKDSIKLSNHALQVTKDNYLAHIQLGSALIEEGKIREAIYNFSEAIRIRPNFYVPYHGRGQLYLMSGNKELGCYDVQKACDLGNCALLEKVRSLRVCL